MKKFLSIVTVIIVVIIIALLVLVKVYVTPERVKAFVVPTAEKSLNREIHVGEVSINIFKGIGLKNFSIKEADRKSDFVKCEDFVLKFKLLPLLSKKVIIDQLKLVSPEISVRRDENGRYNFEDIGQTQKPDETGEEKRKDEKDETEVLPISLLVNKIAIDDAKFSFTDLTKELPDVKSSLGVNMSIESVDGSELFTQGSLDLNLDEVLLREPSEKRIKNIKAALVYAVNVNLESMDVRIDKADLKVQKIPVSVKGDIKNIKTGPEINLAVSMPKVKTADIQELVDLVAPVEGLKLSGNVSTDVKLSGMPDNLDSLMIDAGLIMEGVGIKYDKVDSVLDGNLKFNLISDNIRIDRGDLKIQKVPVSVTGKVKNFKTSPAIDIAVSIPKANTAEIQKMVAPFVDLKGLGLSGNLSADVKLKGTPEKLDTMKADGSILLNTLGVSYQDIDALLDGSITFKEKTSRIKIKSSVGKNTAELQGSISNFFENQKINLNIYAKKLFMDELIPAEKTEKKPPAKKSKSTKQKKTKKDTKEAEPLDLNLTAKGEIKVDSAVYKGMTMSNFYMKYQFANNKLKISKMAANAGKGKFNLASSVDLSKPGYKYKLSSKLKSLHADEVVNALFPKAKDTVFGILSFNLKLNGAGTLAENIKKNLVADGDFKIKDGKITNAKIAENLSLFLNIDELKTINLRKADGTITIRNSIAKLDSVFASDDISMNPAGRIGLDETLDLAFDLKLSPSLTDKAMLNSSIAKYMKDEEGWGIIPLKVSGTFSDPSYTVDIAEAGKRIIEKEADKLIEKLLDKKKTTKKKKKKAETKEEIPELEPVKDLLEGIFGK
jgi:AsmA protein